MHRHEFIIDDFRAANGFVKTLPPKIKAERFNLDRKTGLPINWTPDHVVLVRKNGRTIAMADAIRSEVGDAANGSIVALSGFGSYAVKALLRLKQMLPGYYWESTLRTPTNATVAISRRYFDVTYDESTWELSQELIKRHGPNPRLLPSPIIATDKMRAQFSIPPIKALDTGSRAQILQAAQAPGKVVLVTPNGKQLPHPVLMALAFDILDLSIDVRCHVTRLLIISTSAFFGHSPDPKAAMEIMNPKAFSQFHHAIIDALKNAPTGLAGIFVAE